MPIANGQLPIGSDPVPTLSVGTQASPLCGTWARAVGYRWGLCAIAVLLFSSGCVHRRLTINSNPPGARVLIDGQEVGETPTSIDFTHYGTREIVLQRDGYETLKTLQRVPTPWYQIPGIDFFADNLLPFQLTNRHAFNYQLQPSSPILPTQELLGRANGLRTEAHAGP
jgi:hypothetical protein